MPLPSFITSKWEVDSKNQTLYIGWKRTGNGLSVTEIVFRRLISIQAANVTPIYTQSTMVSRTNNQVTSMEMGI